MKQIILFAIFTVVSSAAFGQTTPPSKNLPVAEHYPGGQDSLYYFINENIIYPPTAKRNRMQGEVVVKFDLMEDGTVESVQLVKDVGGGTGKEALRIVRMLRFNAPGYKMTTTIPIIYKL